MGTRPTVEQVRDEISALRRWLMATDGMGESFLRKGGPARRAVEAAMDLLAAAIGEGQPPGEWVSLGLRPGETVPAERLREAALRPALLDLHPLPEDAAAEVLLWLAGDGSRARPSAVDWAVFDETNELDDDEFDDWNELDDRDEGDLGDPTVRRCRPYVAWLWARERAGRSGTRTAGGHPL